MKKSRLFDFVLLAIKEKNNLLKPKLSLFIKLQKPNLYLIYTI